MEQEIIYSEERGTWNLIVNGEWYYEGTFEECSDMMMNNSIEYNEELDDYYEEQDFEEFI